MIIDPTRELKQTCRLYVLYNPDKPIAEGFYTSHKGNDFESTTPQNNRMHQNKVRINKNDYTLNTSDYLSSVPQVYGGFLPKVNTAIGAPKCTFAFGAFDVGLGSSPHPVFNLINGPRRDQYKTIPTFDNNPRNNSNVENVFPTLEVLQGPQQPFMPFRKSNLYNASAYTTYNIWKITEIKNKNIPLENCQKYSGQIFTDPYTPHISTIDDINNGSYVEVSSPDHLCKVKRIFPISEDIVYGTSEENAKLYCWDQKQKKYEFEVKEKGTYNSSFHLHILPIFPQQQIIGKQSRIEIVIDSMAQTRDVAEFAHIKNRANAFKYIIVLNPNERVQMLMTDQSNKVIAKFDMNVFAVSGQELDLYLHFLDDVLLYGTNPDPNTWVANYPSSKNKQQPLDKYTHGISKNAEIYMWIYYATCRFQFEPLCFNNFDPTLIDDTLPTLTYRYSKDIENTFTLQEYKGYATQLENGISLFKDSRSVLTGNDGQIKLEYYSDTGSKYAQIKFNSAISGPLFVKSENKPSYSLAPVKSLLKPIPDAIGGNLTKYLGDWTMTTNFDQDSKILSATANINLLNLDAAFATDTIYNGMNILALIEQNQLVVEISAGYEQEEVFFQGFITKVTTRRTAAGSVSVLSASDVGSQILENTKLFGFLSFHGAKYKYIFRRIMEHSSFHRFFDFFPENLNPGFQTTLNLNISNTPLEEDVLKIPMYKDVIEAFKLIGPRLNKQVEWPVMFYDPSRQYLKLDWKYDPKYRDQLTLFDIDLTKANSRNTTFNERLTDWHGLLTQEGYSIESDNTRYHANWIAEGSGYEGFMFDRTSISQDPSPILSGNFSVVGYVGYEKSSHKNFGKAMPDHLALRTWLNNQIVLNRKPNYNVSFTCYVTRPLHHMGTFHIKYLWNGGFKLTDNYFYESVSYQCSKKDNTITAAVRGKSIFSLQ
jgi:hypothetical protein